MRFALPRIGLPLLAKELVEQSARRRTYVIRVLYAVTLFVVAYFAFYDVLSIGRGNPFAVLGRGREMFEWVVALQFAGIYLFLPAMASGVLTAEKEQGSLGLLFLTKLGPWTILLEKLFGRLVPMLGLLLLSLPLLALAYSLGGITQSYLWSGVWCLAITMLQVGTLAVMCSAFFRTTTGAFIATYLIGLVLLFALPVLDEFLLLNVTGRTYRGGLIDVPLGHLLSGLGIVERGRDVPFLFFAPYVFYEHGRSAPFSRIVMQSIPVLISAGCFLAAGRACLVRRAFRPPRHYLLRFFRGLDRLFTRINHNRITRGVVLMRPSTALPAEEPIAWREVTKKSLGTARYLFRMFVAVEIPVVAVCILTVTVANDVYDLETLSSLLFVMWVLAVLTVSVKATSLISVERSHRTLEVLLAAPLGSREIVKQKFRGLRRLMTVLSVPLITIVLFEATFKEQLWEARMYYGNPARDSFSVPRYLTASLLSVGVYLPLAAWLSFFIGMFIRSQGRAIIAALAALATWSAGPIFLVVMIDEIWFRGPQPSGFELLLFLSPASIIPVNEFNAFQSLARGPAAVSAWTAIALNFALYGLCLLAFRELSLRSAARLLGRVDEK